MLKDVTKICDENDLKYYLSDGTLLGAIRHKGFIPWDDDIDIGMPLKDYRKFLKIAQNKLSPKYFVQNVKTDKCTNINWTQIRANGTTSMPLKFKEHKIHHGICIDIFPLIGLYKNKFLHKLQNKLLHINLTLISKDFHMSCENTENDSFTLKCIFALPRCVRHFLYNANNKFAMKAPEKSELVIPLWTTLNELKYSWFKTLEKADFEDSQFYIPAGYDEYLKANYNDYMQLPPEDQRGGHTDSFDKIIFDLHRDYSEYK